MIIEQIKKNKLYLSTDEIMDVSPFIRAKYNLKISADITKIYNEISYEAALEKGIFLLSLRDRTKKEILLKLKEKYRNINMVQKAVLKLEELGYIDDFNYTVSFIRNKKYGRQRIEFELFKKGIDKSIIQEVYDYFNQEKDQTNKSIETLKLEKAIKKNIKKEENKLIQYLLRQGFNYGEIIYKLREFKEYGEFC